MEEAKKLIEDFKDFKKFNLRMRRLMICVIILQHVLFIYGCYLLLRGDVYFGSFQVIVNALAIPYNFKSIKDMKKGEEELGELNKILVEMLEQGKFNEEEL